MPFIGVNVSLKSLRRNELRQRNRLRHQDFTGIASCSTSGVHVGLVQLVFGSMKLCPLYAFPHLKQEGPGETPCFYLLPDIGDNNGIYPTPHIPLACPTGEVSSEKEETSLILIGDSRELLPALTSANPEDGEVGEELSWSGLGLSVS